MASSSGTGNTSGSGSGSGMSKEKPKERRWEQHGGPPNQEGQRIFYNSKRGNRSSSGGRQKQNQKFYFASEEEEACHRVRLDPTGRRFSYDYDEPSRYPKDVLTVEECYKDQEMDEICNNWSPAMPDYHRHNFTDSGATNSSTHSYIEELQYNRMISAPKHIFVPSFNHPEFPATLTTASGSGEPHPLVKAGTSSIGQNIQLPEPEPEESKSLFFPLRNAAGKMDEPKPRRRGRSMVDQLVDSVERAIENGDTNFVRGPVHPLQKNQQVLKLNRRSGYTNRISDEDILRDPSLAQLRDAWDTWDT